MLDVIVFAPHPDDAELGAGGTIGKAVLQGLKVGVIDLTGGEMGTLGDKKSRQKEAQKSKKLLGLMIRENLEFPDGIIGIQHTKEQVFQVANKIREYQPKIILAPYWKDRHPDHIACSNIVTKATHYAKLEKVKLDHPKHNVKQIIYYELNGTFRPSFIMDVSKTFALKKKAIMCYESQFKEFKKEYLPFPVEERCWYYGSLINASYGEAFLLKNNLKLDSLTLLF